MKANIIKIVIGLIFLIVFNVLFFLLEYVSAGFILFFY